MSDSFVTPWIVARQAPLSLGFPRQEYWSRFPFPPLEDLPDSGIESVSLVSPVLAGRLFTTKPPWKSWFIVNLYFLPFFPTPSSFWKFLSNSLEAWHHSLLTPKHAPSCWLLEVHHDSWYFGDQGWVLILWLSAALNSWSWVTGSLVLTPSLLAILPSVVPLTHGSASCLVTSTTLIDLINLTAVSEINQEGGLNLTLRETTYNCLGIWPYLGHFSKGDCGIGCLILYPASSRVLIWGAHSLLRLIFHLHFCLSLKLQMCGFYYAEKFNF